MATGWEAARQDWVHDTPVLWKRGMVFNYDFDEGDLARVESLRKLSGMAAVFPDASSFFGTFALRWCVRAPSQKPLPGYRPFGGNAAQVWDGTSSRFRTSAWRRRGSRSRAPSPRHPGWARFPPGAS